MPHTSRFMASVTCCLTAKDRNLLWNLTLVSSMELPLHFAFYIIFPVVLFSYTAVYGGMCCRIYLHRSKPKGATFLSAVHPGVHILALKCFFLHSPQTALTSVVRKDDNDWVKHCMTWEAEGIRQRGRPTKTWWDCVRDDMESLRLSQKDAQSRNKNGEGELRGQPANAGSPEKMAVKTDCVSVDALPVTKSIASKHQR